jgi:hypothetical protein
MDSLTIADPTEIRRVLSGALLGTELRNQFEYSGALKSSMSEVVLLAPPSSSLLLHERDSW